MRYGIGGFAALRALLLEAGLKACTIAKEDTKMQTKALTKQTQKRFSRLDRIALGILCAYLLLVAITQWGGIGGVGLDPIWAAAQQRGTLRVVTDPGWRPFADVVDGEFVGYDMDLARELGRRLNLEIEFRTTGYDALYDSLVNGDADLIAAALPYAPEQGERARFSEFYFNAGQVLVVPTASSINSLDQLSGLRVGTALGSDADGLARRMLNDGARFSLANDFDEASQVLSALALGQLDAAIVDHVAALIGCSQHPNLRIVRPELTFEPYALAMPASAFQLNANVNRVIVELQREGFFEELNQRWFR